MRNTRNFSQPHVRLNVLYIPGIFLIWKTALRQCSERLNPFKKKNHTIAVMRQTFCLSPPKDFPTSHGVSWKQHKTLVLVASHLIKLKGMVIAPVIFQQAENDSLGGFQDGAVRFRTFQSQLLTFWTGNQVLS